MVTFGKESIHNAHEKLTQLYRSTVQANIVNNKFKGYLFWCNSFESGCEENGAKKKMKFIIIFGWNCVWKTHTQKICYFILKIVLILEINLPFFCCCFRCCCCCCYWCCSQHCFYLFTIYVRLLVLNFVNKVICVGRSARFLSLCSKTNLSEINFLESVFINNVLVHVTVLFSCLSLRISLCLQIFTWYFLQVFGQLVQPNLKVINLNENLFCNPDCNLVLV